MSCIIKPNHIALSGSDAVRQICQPFFDSTGISYFTFARQHPYGGRFTLSTCPEWTEYFFSEERFKNITLAQETKTTQPTKASEYWLWVGMPVGDIQETMIRHFNIFNGITIVQQTKKHTDYFYFATQANNIAINNFYLNNLDFLEKFILFFKDQARELLILSGSKENLIFIPKSWSLNKFQICRSVIDHRSLGCRKVFIDEDKHLTRKEVLYARHILKGWTAPEIALALKKSKRTVEAHIANIKNKLECNKKSDLFAKLKHLKIGSFDEFEV